MKLKRHYDSDEAKAYRALVESHLADRVSTIETALGEKLTPGEINEARNAVRDKIKRPKPTGIEVLYTKPKQNFSPRVVHGGINEGWLELADRKLTINGMNKTVVYTIDRLPGHYCCHCDIYLSDGPSAKIHVESHEGEASPDTGNPCGYRRDNFFACSLTEES